MIWAKFFFENMFHRSEITAQSFEKTVLKKRPQYERTSKIHSRGWQAWRNWFFTLTSFLDPVIYWSFFKIAWIEKMTGSEKVITYSQKSVFSCPSTTRRNFWNSFIQRPYFHNCLPELLPHCTFSQQLLQQNYLTS